MSRKADRNRDRMVDTDHLVRQERNRAKRFNTALRLWGPLLEQDKRARMPFHNRKSFRAWMATK